MCYKIVSDSSSNVFAMEGFDYTTVPMKVITSEKEYIDTPDLDVLGMVNDLKAYKGKSGSSCPMSRSGWMPSATQSRSSV